MRNTPAPAPVERARELLRAEAERSSVRAVAKRVGVDNSRLGAFIDGSTVRPRGAMLEAVLAYAARAIGYDVEFAGRGPDRGVDAVLTAPDGARVEVQLKSHAGGGPPLHPAGYWQGRAEEAQRYVRLIAQSAAAIEGVLGGLVTSGVLREDYRGASVATLSDEEVLAAADEAASVLDTSAAPVVKRPSPRAARPRKRGAA